MVEGLMTNRENFLLMIRRKGYEKVPIDFKLCPSLAQRFNDYVNEMGFEYKKAMTDIPDLVPKHASREDFLNYYPHSFKEGTKIDMYGVAHEPGSAAAFHMTKMYNPMNDFDSVEQVSEYPLPDYNGADSAKQIEAIKKGACRGHCGGWKYAVHRLGTFLVYARYGKSHGGYDA